MELQVAMAGTQKLIFFIVVVDVHSCSQSHLILGLLSITMQFNWTNVKTKNNILKTTKLYLKKEHKIKCV